MRKTMKKRIISVLLCTAMAVFMAAGCGTDKSSAGKSDEKEKTEDSSKKLLGISVPKASTGWTAAAQYYAEKYCKENNINANIVAAESTNEQANQIEELINMKCDTILLLPINDELATAAQKVMDAGITLVNFDRTLGSTEPDYYIGGDNKGVGVDGAKYLKEKLGDSYTVVITGISGWGAISEERIQGYKETIKEISPDVEILGEYSADNASQEAGLALMTDILSANPKVDAVFSADDELGIGLTQAILEAKRTDIKAVIGGGGAKGYMAKMASPDFENIWLGTATYSPSMITDAINVAFKAMNGEEVDKNTIIPCDLVDRDNVEQWRKDKNIDENAPY
ncbi:ribose transport system substrate-binding protein [Faecalicatena contorta]|uniref:Ribose transport system substrate-binding protein n=2 Tax=Faecalicatena contorta TaxID=39482 RepID=A0A316A0I7_9FIRM|nr:ribose transport system substrate-binding protein [Faecalicatena contorta]SUQ14008.1 ribose transport system substrate-binding protein [Faecalicatena contorta]